MPKYACVLLSALLLALGTSARAGEPPWLIDGLGVAADSCAIGCPCILGEAPSHPHCHFVVVVHVENGHYGDVSLDGARLGLAGAFTRSSREAPPEFQVIAYYPDANASAEQRQAMRSLFTETAFFGGLGEPAELEELPITLTGLEHFAEVDRTVVATIGDIARVEVTPVGGATDATQPMVIENPGDPFTYWVVFGAATDSFYRGADQSFAFEGTSGESLRVRWSGGEAAASDQ